MTPAELRELDAWIFENIIGGALSLCSRYCPTCRQCVVPHETTSDGRHSLCGALLHCDFPHYTTDGAAALEVLAKCLEKTSVQIIECAGYIVTDVVLDGWTNSADADTIPLAICLFSKRLFNYEHRSPM